MNLGTSPTVVVIDQDVLWRDWAARQLRAAGYYVGVLGPGTDDMPQRAVGIEYTLVILGCAQVGALEKQYIAEFAQQQQAVLVLPVSVAAYQMRQMFLARVTDITDKPCNAGVFLNIVSDIVRGLTAKGAPTLL